MSTTLTAPHTFTPSRRLPRVCARCGLDATSTPHRDPPSPPAGEHNQLSLLSDLPALGSRYVERVSGVTVTVTAHRQRRYAWVVVQMPFWVDWPDYAYMDLEAEIRGDIFARDFDQCS